MKERLSWGSFVEWVFLGLLVYVGTSINSNISEMQKGINQLNIQVSTMLSENNISKEAIRDHEIRLRDLERKFKK